MKQKILIIDDSEVDRRIISSIIKMNIPDAEVLESNDGLNIMEIAMNNQVMACVLDLKMPDIDGVDVLRSLKSDESTADIPVIVCTGIANLSIMEQVFKLGAYDYFTKPFSNEAMKYALPLKIRNAFELSKRTNHILHMSQIDDLTQLYNRRYFKDFLDEKMKNSPKVPFTILMCDINGLKVVNDAFGSSVGDFFLKKVADTLKSELPPDSIISRWGGDEFAVYLPNCSNSEVAKLTKRIKSKIHSIQYSGIQIGLAVGVETINEVDEDLFHVLKLAEDAMFRDKILENNSTHSAMIATVLHTLNVKNPREEAHSRRVSELCVQMGKAMAFSEKEIRDLKLIGLLHDIGKITIDEKILNKPDKLTDEEYAEIRRHPELGYRILSASKEMDPYLDIILCHHERMDGKGYPNGLKGKEIPLMSRILSVIDSYDAMTCHRPYRKAKEKSEAIQELIDYSGTQFDPEIVDLFVHRVLVDFD